MNRNQYCCVPGCRGSSSNTKLKFFRFPHSPVRQVNQDALENTFGAVRQHCGSNNNPSVGQFVDALKTVIINGLAYKSLYGTNCEDDGASLLDKLHSFFKPTNASSTSQSTSHDSEATDTVPDIGIVCHRCNKGIDFDWIRSAGCSLHQQRIEDGIVRGVTSISIPWWCKQKNQLMNKTTRQKLIKRKFQILSHQQVTIKVMTLNVKNNPTPRCCCPHLTNIENNAAASTQQAVIPVLPLSHNEHREQCCCST